MRKLLLFVALLFAASFAAPAQMTVEVTVVDEKQQPLPKARVALTEDASAAVVEGTTDNKGATVLLVAQTGTWRLTVNGHDTGHEPVRVTDVEEAKSIFYLTYHPALDARTSRQSFDRRGLTMRRTGAIPESPKPGWNIVEIQVTDTKKRRQPGLPVTLVNLRDKLGYTATSGADGVAWFHVPGGRPYDIDVAEQRNAAYLLMEDRVNYTLMQFVTYDSYQMQERRNGDTITQQFALPVAQRASRALYRLQVSKGGKPWRKGTVYLDATGSSEVYTARTDTTGTAWFLLPFGLRYLVHFPYQRDVTVVNLLQARQEARGSAEIEYHPDPRLEFPERYLPRPGQLTLTHFRYYHKQPYPIGTDPHLEGSATAVGKEAVLHFGIGGMNAGARDRLPLNYAFVLDVSGSMAGYDRIESLQRGIRKLLVTLRPTDRISITTFNDGQRVVLPSLLAGGNGPRIDAAIAALEPTGGTDMREALRTGYKAVAQHWNERTDNRVILLSDGYDTNPDDTLLAVQAPFRNKISCQAIGVGNDYNTALMTKLSDAGGLQQAREGVELERYVQERLLNLTPVATDITVEATFGKELRLRSVYGLESLQRTETGFSGRLSRLLAGEDLPCVAGFALADSSRARAATASVQIRCRYRNALTGAIETKSQQVELRFGSAESGLSETEKMYAIARCNDRLEELAAFVAMENYPSAATAASQALQAFAQNPGWQKDADLRKLLEELRRYWAALQQHQKSRKDVKKR